MCDLGFMNCDSSLSCQAVKNLVLIVFESLFRPSHNLRFYDGSLSYQTIKNVVLMVYPSLLPRKKSSTAIRFLPSSCSSFTLMNPSLQANFR